MGFRFQKRVSLFPGVRLNFSSGGISTTIGVRGASVTVGSRGSYLNLGIPGSGLSYRTKLGGVPAGSAPNPAPTPAFDRLGPSPDYSAPALPDRPLLPGEGEISSGPVSSMTSAGLGELKKLINEAAREHSSLQGKVRSLEDQLSAAEKQLKFAMSFIVRLALWNRIPVIQAEIRQLREEMDAARQRLAAALINIDFAFDDETLEAYRKLEDAFRLVGRCSRIWDVTASYFTDRVRERTTAGVSINRSTVALGLGRSEIINTAWEALRFGNTNGEDLYVYPGFAMMRGRAGDFALVDINELEMTLSPMRFIEEETVPGDTQIVGQTWKKANKDGSRDKRFAGNYQIPIVRYGELEISSKTGIREAYHISNEPVARQFAETYRAYQDALKRLAAKSKKLVSSGSEEDDGDIVPALTSTNWLPLPERPSAKALLLDCASILAVVLIGVFFLTQSADVPEAKLATVEQQAVIQPLSPGPASTPDAAMPQAPERVTVKAGSANLRATPSKTATIVGSLKKGTVVSLLEQTGEWLKVQNGNEVGWLHLSTTERSSR